MSPSATHSSFARRATALALLIAATLGPDAASAQSTWGVYGGTPQHTAISQFPSQSLDQIVWQTPVDLNPPYSGNVLYIHYGCPVVSALNTIIVPVKTGVADSFRVEARAGRDGSLRWQLDSDYSLPAHNWVPSFGPALTPRGRLYMDGAGGTVLVVDNVEGSTTPASTRIAFYGLANYNANPAAFAADVRICTPLTSHPPLRSTRETATCRRGSMLPPMRLVVFRTPFARAARSPTSRVSRMQ